LKIQSELYGDIKRPPEMGGPCESRITNWIVGDVDMDRLSDFNNNASLLQHSEAGIETLFRKISQNNPSSKFKLHKRVKIAPLYCKV